MIANITKSKLCTIWVVLLPLAILFSSCKANTYPVLVRIESPSLFTEELKPLADETFSSIEQIGILFDDSNPGEIISLVPQTEDQLLVAYNNGYLYHWSLIEKKKIQDKKISSSIAQISFSKDGHLALTPNTTIDENRMTDEEIVGFRIWDTKIGEVMHCFGSGCAPDTDQWKLSKTAVILSPDGKWFVEAGKHSISISLTEDATTVANINLFSPDNPNKLNISSICFDEDSEYLAIAFDDGNVYINDFKNMRGASSWGTMSELGRPDRQHIPVIDMTFDPTRQWLAVARGTDVSIWNVITENKFTTLQDYKDIRSLAFDRTGRFLLIAHQAGLSIIDVLNGNKIAYWPLSGITKISVSPDNRMIIWGDAKGIIHLWGTKN
jgi:WD40 repeat protein